MTTPYDEYVQYDEYDRPGARGYVSEPSSVPRSHPNIGDYWVDLNKNDWVYDGEDWNRLYKIGESRIDPASGDPEIWDGTRWFRVLNKPDMVNEPPHYIFEDGVEVIDLTEQLNFNCGNAVKYVARAGRKDPAKAVEDLEKAAFYVAKEIARVKRRAVV